MKYAIASIALCAVWISSIGTAPGAPALGRSAGLPELRPDLAGSVAEIDPSCSMQNSLVFRIRVVNAGMASSASTPRPVAIVIADGEAEPWVGRALLPEIPAGAGVDVPVAMPGPIHGLTNTFTISLSGGQVPRGSNDRGVSFTLAFRKPEHTSAQGANNEDVVHPSPTPPNVPRSTLSGSGGHGGARPLPLPFSAQGANNEDVVHPTPTPSPSLRLALTDNGRGQAIRVVCGASGDDNSRSHRP